MGTKSAKIFLLLMTLCKQSVITVPISVPVDNNYSYNPSYTSSQNYNDENISSRRPNAYFNRLPPNSQQVQVDDTSDNGSENDYDYEDQQTDKPVINTSNQQYSSQNYNNLLNTNFLLNENRVKFKKKRRIRRPCIPIQSFGSPLFSNRLKREINNDAESGKTFNHLFGGFNSNYYSPYYQSGSQGQYSDNVKPQYDSQSSAQTQYSPYGGYPCIPVSYGNRPGSGLLGGGGPFGGGGLLGGGPFGGGPFGGNRPFRPFSGGAFGDGPFGGGAVLGGGGGGPLGFFGQGGLLDFASPGPGPLSPAGVYQGSGNYPQTVIINRPPLFANPPNFNRPQQSGGGQYPSDSSTAGSGGQPFWGTVLDKLSEFVTGINPQQIYSSIGESLQGVAQAIQNTVPAAPGQAIRQGYKEFSSLIFR